MHFVFLSLSLFSLFFLFPPSCLGVPGCFRHSCFSWCVLGRLCRSWEPRARCVHIQKRHCNRFSMRCGFIGSCSLHLFPFSLFPFTHTCSPLFFHVLLSSCLGISFLLSFAYTPIPALVCTCTHTCTSNLNPGFRSPRFSQ